MSDTVLSLPWLSCIHFRVSQYVHYFSYMLHNVEWTAMIIKNYEEVRIRKKSAVTCFRCYLAIAWKDSVEILTVHPSVYNSTALHLFSPFKASSRILFYNVRPIRPVWIGLLESALRIHSITAIQPLWTPSQLTVLQHFQIFLQNASLQRYNYTAYLNLPIECSSTAL